MDIRFTRNIPDQLVPSTAQELVTYKGTISEHTLLGLVPFVENVDEELALLEEERNANMELFRNESNRILDSESIKREESDE